MGYNDQFINNRCNQRKSFLFLNTKLYVVLDCFVKLFWLSEVGASKESYQVAYSQVLNNA
jgi:hypothetical protein